MSSIVGVSNIAYSSFGVTIKIVKTILYLPSHPLKIVQKGYTNFLQMYVTDRWSRVHIHLIRRNIFKKGCIYVSIF